MYVNELGQIQYNEEEQEFVVKARLLFNDLCIYGDSDIVRVIGVMIGEDDFYYLLRYIHGKEIAGSAVCGRPISLKNIYPRYEGMDLMFENNQCPKELEFKICNDSYKEPCKKCEGKGEITRYRGLWGSSQW